MIAPRQSQPEEILKLKITLAGSKPPIWRRVLVPAECTLGELHDVIQCVMPWENYHLHEFMIGDQHVGVPDPEFGDRVLDEETFLLSEVFSGKRKRIRYLYDFGDGWQHDIALEQRLDAEDGTFYPACTGGRNACPPEDSGSLWGYYRKLEILKDPDHPEYAEIEAWMPLDFDPSLFSAAEAAEALRTFVESSTPLDRDDVDRLANMCAWCRKTIPEGAPVYATGLHVHAGFELSADKNPFLLLELGPDRFELPAMMTAPDSQAKQDGKDLMIMLCSEECVMELEDAILDDPEFRATVGDVSD